METKFEKLEKVLSELNISDKELMNWVNNRSKSPAGLIPTELPLVYRRGNILTVENGLNLSRKHELWGIRLLSGVMVALTCGSDTECLMLWQKLWVRRIVTQHMVYDLCE